MNPFPDRHTFLRDDGATCPHIQTRRPTNPLRRVRATSRRGTRDRSISGTGWSRNRIPLGTDVRGNSSTFSPMILNRLRMICFDPRCLDPRHSNQSNHPSDRRSARTFLQQPIGSHEPARVIVSRGTRFSHSQSSSTRDLPFSAL